MHQMLFFMTAYMHFALYATDANSFAHVMLGMIQFLILCTFVSHSYQVDAAHSWQELFGQATKLLDTYECRRELDQKRIKHLEDTNQALRGHIEEDELETHADGVAKVYN